MLILIGGYGFIGRHLRDSLATKPIDKLYIVSRTTARDAYPNEIFVLPAEFSALIASTNEDVTIVYLAWASTPATYADTPWKEIEYNVKPLMEYLAKSVRVAKTKIIFISSGGTVYGNIPDAVRATEDMPLNPISSYGLAKTYAEQSVRFFGRCHDFATCVLRVSNPVGRHQISKVQGIVPALIRALQEGRPFTAFGANVVRDYVDADDLSDAIIAAIEDRSFRHSVWNVGSGVGHTIAEIIAIVEHVTKKRVDIQLQPQRPFDVDRVVLDCSRIAGELGWWPSRDLSETVERIWQLQARGL